MKKISLSGLVALVGILVSAQDSWAQLFKPPCTTYVDQVVTCYKPKLQRVEVQCVKPKIVCREVVTQKPCTVLVPKYCQEVKVVPTITYVPHVVERDMVKCRTVPVTVTDPCTGCCYKTFRTETYVERVKCTVYEPKCEKKEVVVPVVRYEKEVRNVECRQLVRECVPTTVTRCRLAIVQVPCTTTIRVPVCLPRAGGTTENLQQMPNPMKEAK